MKKAINITVDEEVKEKLLELCKKHKRSQANMIAYLISKEEIC